MFTGIIEDLGVILKTNRSGLEISTGLDTLKIGDSVSVNGVCLTITKTNQKSYSFSTFLADVSGETLKLTNLGELKPGSMVNLERSLRTDSRLGGHMVTGHIEGIGRIVSIKNDKNSRIYEFSYPKELGNYIVKKGSIAVDGISLTVADIKKANSFTVAVIPHTLKNTTLNFKKTGDKINLETDIMAKYIKKSQQNQKENSKISFDLLKRTGFIR
ncbi:MAG: riboflavin synthase subunit alpha [Elusimicrobia bacterium RIFOXYA2_FULL_40_6]|nr:MAG: riboflavin synthase subunit alpha [Elusimicrobia bacterium RIFOXYA2_FULL_40_6]